MTEGGAVRQRAALRRRAGRLAVLAAGLALAACAAVVPRGAEPAQAPPPPVYAPPAVEAGIPHDTQRNRVALLVPMSGGNAGVGQSIANATQLAMLDTGTTAVRVTTYDTAPSGPNGGAAAAARHAIDDGAQLILGPLLAEDARQVGPIARAAGVPVLSFSNDSGVAGNGTFVMGYVPAQSVERVVGYARSRGVTTFAGMVPNGLYGERASTAFLRAVEAGGGQVLSLQTYARTPASIAGAAARVAARAPYGAVLIADGGAVAASAAAGAKRGSAGAHVLGTELWNAESSIAARPQLAGGWFASVGDGLYRQFAAKYRGRFGAGPYRLASLGYDAVLLTVRIARDWPIGARFPENRLRDPEGFAGLDGAFRFGRDGVAERALEVQEIRGGTTVVVSPAPTGFAH
ncbi:penicillin-binding protein activator [Sphingomonas sp.]|uniref:penicillin-binding protein activator n=1 Tax=Sphingomonas sp. TaxID=28214 RepID=UPI003CC66B6A